MADTVKVNKLRDTPDQSAHLLCSSSDGTGESAVRKIVIATLAMAATKVRIKKLRWSISGQMTVKLAFDHTTPDVAIILSGNGELVEDRDAPIIDPGSAGGVGDIMLTSVVTAATVGQGYTIYIELAKVA